MRFRWLSLAVVSVASTVFCFSNSPVGVAQQTKTAPSTTTTAEDDESEEVVTVAIAPLDKILPNIGYLMNLAGFGGQAGIVNQAVNGYTNGLDRSRPIGSVVYLNEVNQPISIACLPVKDLDSFLSGLELFGEPEDLGEGLYSMSFGAVTVFAKQDGDWLFVSSDEDSLDDLPKEATAQFAKMVAKNDIKFEFNIQNIPEQLLDLLKDQMRTGFEQAMEAQRDDMTADDLEASRASGEQVMKNFEEVLENTEKIAVGLAISSQQKAVILDMGSLFVDGSRFAKQLEATKGLKSSLGAVVTEGSMIAAQSLSVVAKEDLAQIENTLQTSLKAAYKAIDEKTKDKASAEKAKSYIDRLVKIFLESCKQGSLETALNVTNDSSLNVGLSFTVADSSKIEGLASDIAAEAAKEKGPFKLQVNVGTYKGVNLHKATITVPEEADDSVRKILGDAVTISIGTAPKAVHLSIGKTAEAALKATIDRVAAKPSSNGEVAKARIDVSQVLGLIQSVDSNPVVDAMLNSMSAGDDMILVDSQVINRGSVVRITVQEGLIKGIAAGVKAGQPGGGGF